MELAVSTMTVADLRAVMDDRIRQIHKELDELRSQGVRLCNVAPEELLLFELAGYTVDLVTGVCSREPAATLLTLPLAGEIDSATGVVALYKNGQQ